MKKREMKVWEGSEKVSNQVPVHVNYLSVQETDYDLQPQRATE